MHTQTQTQTQNKPISFFKIMIHQRRNNRNDKLYCFKAPSKTIVILVFARILSIARGAEDLDPFAWMWSPPNDFHLDNNRESIEDNSKRKLIVGGQNVDPGEYPYYGK
jgi:hypothetical protein